jgi:predicted HAD superfamily Cof-like phosphohydrolase
VNKMQQQVRDFMVKMGQVRSDYPQVPDSDTVKLRDRLMAQEMNKELIPAMYDGDVVKVIDGLCDVLYTVFGTAEAFGITDLQAYFDEVHRTNMLKDPAVRDVHGKVLKPEGWRPPRIAEMLEADLASKAHLVLEDSAKHVTAMSGGYSGAVKLIEDEYIKSNPSNRRSQ